MSLNEISKYYSSGLNALYAKIIHNNGKKRVSKWSGSLERFSKVKYDSLIFKAKIKHKKEL